VYYYLTDTLSTIHADAYQGTDFLTLVDNTYRFRDVDGTVFDDANQVGKSVC
jgi:hypothetical protein